MDFVDTSNPSLFARTMTAPSSSSKRQQWNENYDKALLFAKEHNHLRLSFEDTETRRLANWLNSQKRRAHIPDDQREKLEALEQYMGNILGEESGDKKWNQMFDKLVEYGKHNQQFAVPIADKSNKKLYNWIARQRRMARQGRLRDDRKKRLEEVGFDFHLDVTFKKSLTKEQKENWNKMYDELYKYFLSHGHCRISRYDTKHGALSQWCSVQRVAKSKGIIKEERKKKLEQLGFKWSLKERH